MVTQAQLDELGTRTEQEQARTITEQILTQQGLATPLSQQTIGVQRLVQFFINEPEAVQRLKGATLRPAAPTTEQILQQSIPAELRGLSPAEVRAGQNLLLQTTGGISQPAPQPFESQSLFQRIFVEKPKEFIQKGVGEIKEFFGGETQIPIFVGVGGRIPVSDITGRLKEADVPFLVKGAAEVTERVGVTPGRLAITTGFVGGLGLAPKIIRAGVGTFVTGTGGIEFFKGETEAERGAGLIIGGLGLAGTTFEVIPFARGIGARGTKIDPLGFEVIKAKDFDIGLIQPGKGARIGIDLPKESPLVRGGFGVRPTEKALFIKEQQFLTTSQRGFFEEGRVIPIEREFFVTPQEPFLKIPETRVSRLGLEDLFKIPREAEIGFGIPKVPQIGVTRGAVRRVETPEAFVIGRGTELEAIKTTGIITDIGKIGRARIRGQGVDIFEFKIGKAPKGRDLDFSGKGLDFRTTRPTARVTGETLLSTAFTLPTRGLTFPTLPITTLGLSLDFFPRISPRPPPTRSPFIPTSLGISPTTIRLIPPRIPTTPTTRRGLDFEPPIPPRRLRRRPAERKKKKIKKKPGKRRTTPLAPSFTASVLQLRGKFPTIIEGVGISPAEIRRLPTRKTTKRKSPRGRFLTDL